LSSAAVSDPALVERCAKRWGSQAVVVAIDVIGTGEGSEVVTRGGRHRTGLSAPAWAERVVALGAGEILLTSVDRDGTLAGYDLDLLRAVCRVASVPIIASGGAGSLEHLLEGLREGASG